jgi:hypothetical protein
VNCSLHAYTQQIFSYAQHALCLIILCYMTYSSHKNTLATFLELRTKLKDNIQVIRFHVLVAVTVKILVFWDVVPCGAVYCYRWRGTCHLNCQHRCLELDNLSTWITYPQLFSNVRKIESLNEQGHVLQAFAFQRNIHCIYYISIPLSYYEYNCVVKDCSHLEIL